MADNTVILIGSITRDPEVQYTTSGGAVAKFGLAVNRRWQNKQTLEWQEEVSFLNCTLWGTLAENAAETMRKGTRAIVTGRLQQRSWETESGEKKSVVEVVVDDCGPSLRWATAEVVKNERRGVNDAPAADDGGW